jgi:hypothetical protein
MIKFERNGENVDCLVTLQIPDVGIRIFHFGFYCGSDTYAGLLQAEATRVLEKRIESIRRFEYNRGYADGRAKRGKANYFNSTLRLI